MKKVTKRYDQYGNLSEETIYDEQGNVLERTVYEYEEDKILVDPHPFVFPKLRDVRIKEPEEISVEESENNSIPQEERGSDYSLGEPQNGRDATLIIWIATAMAIVMVITLIFVATQL